MTYTEPRHPINFVCRRTGLNTHLIRAWENRYGAVVPKRTETNRRLYSDSDIDRLKLLSKLVSEGHTISQIAGLKQASLESILRASKLDDSSPEANAKRREAPSTSADILHQCQAAVSGLNAQDILEALMNAQVRLSQPVLLSKVIGPLLQWIGDAWRSGSLRIAHEHLAISILRDFLAELRRKNRPGVDAPVLVVATPAGELHEFGALMVSLSAAADGWRDLYLGPNTPWQEIAAAVGETKATAVALSIAYPGDNALAYSELEQLRRYVPENIPILVGGSGAVNHRLRLQDLGVTCADDLDDLRATLSALRE